MGGRAYIVYYIYTIYIWPINSLNTNLDIWLDPIYFQNLTPGPQIWAATLITDAHTCCSSKGLDFGTSHGWAIHPRQPYQRGGWKIAAHKKRLKTSLSFRVYVSLVERVYTFYSLNHMKVNSRLLIVIPNRIEHNKYTWNHQSVAPQILWKGAWTLLANQDTLSDALWSGRVRTRIKEWELKVKGRDFWEVNGNLVGIS